MKLAELLKKRNEEDTNGKNKRVNDTRELEIYSGMQVIVENSEGQMLFVAKLQDPQRNMAELYQYSETGICQDMEGVPLQIRLRGYNDWKSKAVFMEGTMLPKQKHIWKIEDLVITRIENERAYSRLSTDIDASVTSSGGNEEGEKSCKVLNISVGGVSIGSEYRYYKGDRFILKAKLAEDRPVSVMYCEVLRVVEKATARYEYGCRFLELTEADQEEITQAIALLTEEQKNA